MCCWWCRVRRKAGPGESRSDAEGGDWGGVLCGGRGAGRLPEGVTGETRCGLHCCLETQRAKTDAEREEGARGVGRCRRTTTTSLLQQSCFVTMLAGFPSIEKRKNFQEAIAGEARATKFRSYPRPDSLSVRARLLRVSDQSLDPLHVAPCYPHTSANSRQGQYRPT